MRLLRVRLLISWALFGSFRSSLCHVCGSVDPFLGVVAVPDFDGQW